MLTVVNWNLWRARRGSARGRRVEKQLRSSGADVYFLTEADERMAPALGFQSVHSSHPGSSHSLSERFCSIWTRWPLESLNSMVSDPERCAAARLEHPVLGGIILYCCVLPWRGDKWRDHESKGGIAFKAALELYRNDWARIRQKFDGEIFLLGGDFNQSLVDRHYYGSAHQQQVLEDTLAQERLVALTSYKNDPVSKNSFPEACIDHVCISTGSGLHVRSCERWPDGLKPDHSLSDHFGITVALEKD